jgi:RHS repeat-associated protein/uncharacterized repeat protein (TIGR01451 family)
MRSARTLVVVPTLLAVLAGVQPAALAQPDPGRPASEPGAAVSTAPRYTPYSRTTVGEDGKLRAELFQVPAFTRFGSGQWRAVDTKVRRNPDPAAPDAFTVAGGYRPLEFGRSLADMVSVKLDRGQIRLSPVGLRGAGKPELTGQEVLHRDVATDTDLTVRPSGAGFRTVLRLKSPQAPTSFRFHLSDPAGQLGQPSRTADGGYEFGTQIEPGVRFGLRPAYAYEVDLDDPEAPVGSEPGSATLTVTRAGNGFDIVKTIDSDWLRGKSFPIELDPLAYFGAREGTAARDCNVVDRDVQSYNYCPSDDMEVGYGSGTDTAWSLRRSLAYFDVSSVPSDAHVNGASVKLYLKANHQSTTMQINAFRTGETWTNAATWRTRNGLTSWAGEAGGAVGSALSSDLVSGQGGFNTWSVTSLARQWVSRTVPNQGVTLKMASEPACCTGAAVMRFATQEDAYAEYWPYMVVDYTPRPGPPSDVRATEGDTASTVRWGPPANATEAQVSNYLVRAHPAANPSSIEKSQACAAPCGELNLGSLVNGRAYVFSVVAQNAYSTGPQGDTPSGVQYVPYGKPGVPGGVGVSVGYSPQTATVKWLASAPNGRAITSYTVDVYDAGSTTKVRSQLCESTCATDTRNVTFSDLTDGKAYDFTVTATAAAPDPARENSDASPRVRATPHGKPGPPGITGVGRGDQSASVSWSAPTVTNNATIIGYAVRVYEHATGAFVTQDTALAAGARYREFSGLTNGTKYRFTVAARYSVTDGELEGDPAYAGPVTPARVPDQPATVATSTSGGTMTVTWTPGGDGGEPISGYVVTAHNAADGSQVGQQKTPGASARSETFQLPAGSDYYAKVAANNVIGTGPAKQSSSVPVLHPVGVAKQILGTAKAVYDTGDTVTYELTLTNPNTSTAENVVVHDVAQQGLTVLPRTLTGAASCSTPGVSCGTTRSSSGETTFAITLPSVPAGTSTLRYTAQVDAGQRACRQLTNTALLPSDTRAPASGTGLLACGSGLGLEPWWSYVTRQLGPQSQLSVNVGSGNAVVTAVDSTPVQGRGRLAYVLRRTYNSSAAASLPLPGSLGAGWTFNFGELGDAAVDGVTGSALVVPSLGSALETITNPLSLVLADRDGTRHLFTPRALSVATPVTTGGGVRGELAASTLSAPAGKTLCVDMAYTAPAGVHLGVWRYIATTSTSCEVSATTDPVVVGFAAVRPDRLRSEYDALGRLRAVIDPAGVQLRYLYGQDPLNTADFGRLTAVFEPASCRDGGSVPTSREQLASSCRAFRFDYTAAFPTSGPARVSVLDPARRTTVYHLDRALPRDATDPAAHLTAVDNPDGSSISYSYGGCGGSPDQLCAISYPDPTPGGSTTTTLSYGFAANDPAGSPARVTRVTDRRGAPTIISYPSQSETVADTANPRTGAAAQNATPGQQLVYRDIDHAGRVGTQETYDLDSGQRLHKTSYRWDTAGCRAGRDAADSARPDNNLCQTIRHAAAKSTAGKDSGGGDVNDGTADERTEYRYTPEGLLLRQRRVLAAGEHLDTTHGYSTQYIAATGTPVLARDQVQPGGEHSISSNGPTGDTLFAVTDLVQSQTPRGNRAAAGAHLDFLTTVTVDNNSNVAVNATGEQRAPSGADTPCRTINDDGTAYGTPVPVANTGAVCQLSGPSTTADGKPTVTRASYDGFGQKSTATSAKALAEASSTSPPRVTSYTYFPDGDDSSAARDITGTIRIGGWLRHVIDPAGKFVAFDYDAAGNTVRTWDRDATDGKARDGYPGPLTAARTDLAPPAVPGLFSQTRYGSGTDAFSKPWRYVRASANQLGERTELTVDVHGNLIRSRPPRGTAAGTDEFDTVHGYTAGDLPVSTATPLQAKAGTATRFSYDVFGNPVSELGPDSAGETAGRHAAVHRYDAAGRLTQNLTSRGPATGPDTGAGCRLATAADHPIVAGAQPHVLCTTSTGYDHVDNATRSVDGNGTQTLTSFDALHRPSDWRTDRDADGLAQVRTSAVYDADGNTVRGCTGRHYTEGAGKTTGSCAQDAVHAEHTRYNPAGRPVELTRYRQAGQPLTSRIQYDADGNPVATTDPRGATPDGTDVTVQASYDLLGRQTSRTVPRAGTTRQLYTASGDLLARLEPGTAADNTGGPPVRATGYRYDPAHRVVDAVQALQVDTTSEQAVRDAIGTAVADADRQVNLRTRLGYDPDGRVIVRYEPRAFTGPGQNGAAALLATPDGRFAARTDYDADGRPVTSYTPRTDATVDDPTRQAAAADDQGAQCPAGAPGYPAGVHVCRTAVSYDAIGNTTAVQLATSTTGTAAARKLLYRYTDDNLLLTVDAPDPQTAGARVQAVRNSYDGVGRVVAETNALGRVRTRSYTADGLLAQHSEPDGPNGLRHDTFKRYDADGQLVAVETPRTTFDATTGAATGSQVPVQRASYFADGLLQSVTTGRTTTTPATQFPAVDNTTSYSYDGAGNAVAVTSPNANANDNSNAVGAATRYAFTADNLLAQVTQPVKVSTTEVTQSRVSDYSYDPAGRKTAVAVALTGTGAAAGGSQSFGYHPSDLLARQTGRDAQQITHGYDAAGNPTQVAGGGITTTGSYYLDGLPREVRSDGRRHGYAYDGAGSITARSTAVDGGTPTVTRYSRNDAGLPTSMTGGASTQTWQYTQLGQPKAHQRGTGVTQSWAYGSDDLLATTTVSGSNGLLAQWDYRYDELGRILSQAYRGKAAAPAAATGGTGSGPVGTEPDTTTPVAYRSTYDPAGRLASFTDARGTRTLRFDRNSNRTAYGEGAQPDAASWTYRADDAIATATVPGDLSGGAVVTRAYEYEAFGGMRSDGCMAHSYDGFDRLAKITPTACRTRPTISYGYDALDRQTRRTTSGQASSQLSYDGWSDTLEQHRTGGTLPSTTTYTLGPDNRPLTAAKDGATAEQLFQDGTGSIGLITLPDQSVRCVARYDAYGNPDSNTALTPTGACASGSADNEHYYRGQRKDADTGNYQLGSRTYDPAKASFLTPDNYRTGGSAANTSIGIDPLTRNTYSYVNGDPLNLTDPNGHEPRRHHNPQYRDPNPNRNDSLEDEQSNQAAHARAVAAQAESKRSREPSWFRKSLEGSYNQVAGAGAGFLHVTSDMVGLATQLNPFLQASGASDYLDHYREKLEDDFVRFQRERLGVDTDSLGYKIGDKNTQITAAFIPIAGAASKARPALGLLRKARRPTSAAANSGKALTRYDADFAIGQLTSGGRGTASGLVDIAESQGWKAVQSSSGPLKYVDSNGIERLVIKRGSARTPGSDFPHVAIRNAAGQRVDAYGYLVTRSSPGNHTPITYDLP